MTFGKIQANISYKDDILFSQSQLFMCEFFYILNFQG